MSNSKESSGSVLHDLVVVGGGPAGVGASIYAESEDIETVVLDKGLQIGGQAGTSSMIKNYPGIPNVTGLRLMSLIVDHASEFDAEFRGPTNVVDLETVDEGFLIRTDNNREYLGRNVLLSTGTQLRILEEAKNLPLYLGRGVNYGSPNLSVDYKDKRIIVVGGGNSAGQAAQKLAEACQVNIFVRGDDIRSGMSEYLVEELESDSNITVFPNTELQGVDGDGRVTSVTVFDNKKNETTEMEADEVFILIGSEPNTYWLPPGIIRDRKRFVVAGTELSPEDREAFKEKTKGRYPLGHETSIPGVFVAGDVRSGSGKRVAFAVNDGLSVVPELHTIRAYRPSSSR